MRRVLVFLGLIIVIGGVAFAGGAGAQEPDYPATIAALQTKVAALQTSVAKRDAKIDEQRTRIAELKEPASTATATPTESSATTAKFGQFELSYIAASFAPTAGQSINTQTAKGIYLLVTIAVVNTSAGPLLFDGYFDLAVRNSVGLMTGVDWEATYVETAYSYDLLLTDQLQPGLTYYVAAAFDVAEGTSGYVLTSTNNAFKIATDV